MKLTPALPTLAAALTLAAAAPADNHGTCSTSTSAAGKDIVETALAAGNFGTLATALKAGGLVEALQGEGPFTVFAPTDAAFAHLPEGTLAKLLEPEQRGTLRNILTYHVVPGRVMAADVVELSSATALNGQRLAIETNDDGVHVAGVRVTKTDITCSNGVIHVLDAVMMPATKNIPETAVAAGQFETLVAALGAAELVETLAGEGPFTVFAPSDEAFAKLPAGTVESLLKPENRDQLVSILTYHVVPGRVYSDQLESGHVATLQGSNVDVQVGEKGVRIGGARVAAADIETTNGVIHVIDRVLLPE